MCLLLLLSLARLLAWLCLSIVILTNWERWRKRTEQQTTTNNDDKNQRVPTTMAQLSKECWRPSQPSSPVKTLLPPSSFGCPQLCPHPFQSWAKIISDLHWRKVFKVYTSELHTAPLLKSCFSMAVHFDVCAVCPLDGSGRQARMTEKKKKPVVAAHFVINFSPFSTSTFTVYDESSSIFLHTALKAVVQKRQQQQSSSTYPKYPESPTARPVRIN